MPCGVQLVESVCRLKPALETMVPIASERKPYHADPFALGSHIVIREAAKFKNRRKPFGKIRIDIPE
jgi:hypothetical protein